MTAVAKEAEEAITLILFSFDRLTAVAKEAEEAMNEADDEGWVTVTKSSKIQVISFISRKSKLGKRLSPLNFFIFNVEGGL